MALYHANAKVISRSGGRSSMSNAAYICGEKATDIRTGTTFDYRNKAGEVLYKNILLPQGMEHLNNTEILWNAVEEFETIFKYNDKYEMFLKSFVPRCLFAYKYMLLH